MAVSLGLVLVFGLATAFHLGGQEQPVAPAQASSGDAILNLEATPVACGQDCCDPLIRDLTAPYEQRVYLQQQGDACRMPPANSRSATASGRGPLAGQEVGGCQSSAPGSFRRSRPRAQPCGQGSLHRSGATGADSDLKQAPRRQAYLPGPADDPPGP